MSVQQGGYTGGGHNAQLQIIWEGGQFDPIVLDFRRFRCNRPSSELEL